MALQYINFTARVPRYLAQKKLLRKNLLTVCDVGARGGFEPWWELFEDQVQLIGFEPNKEEYDRISQNAPAERHYRYYQAALYKEKARKTFYHAKLPDSSSIYPPDEAFMKRFTDFDNLLPLSTSEMEMTDFDSLAQEQGIPSPDFVKVDVEGAELDILEGMRGHLKNVLGISIEVLFQPIRQGAPTFERAHAFMTEQKFCLYDLTFYRHVRGNFMWRSHPPSSMSCLGQPIWGQALYLRDFPSLLKENKETSPETILKMLGILDVFYLQDCALELLETCATMNILIPSMFLELQNLLNLQKEDLKEFTRQREGFLIESFGNILNSINS